jgi:hypothetical protein
MALRVVGRFGALIGGGIIALGAAMPVLEAQTPAPRQNVPSPTDRNDGTITVTGCLLLGPYGDYTLSTTIAPAGAVMNAVAWKLEDNKQLLAHLLEKVEITGTMLPMPDAPRAVGTTGSGRPGERDDATEYRLRVKTIKKVGGCS